MLPEIAELKNCISEDKPREEKAQTAVRIIRQHGYRWAGLYDVGQTEISVIAWDGPSAPTFPTFPVNRGLNGAAVASRKVTIVQDVTTDSRYLTTLGSTKGEMIVPVLHDGVVVGTIDVESDRLNAFSDEDTAFLETCAKILLPLWIR
jgi:L-methionine (R)-S-oxide reductase